MAWAEVASQIMRATGSSVSSKDISTPNNVAVGDYVVIGGGLWHGTPSGITDVFVSQNGGSASIETPVVLFNGNAITPNGGSNGYAFEAYCRVSGAGTLTLNVSTNQGSGVYFNLYGDVFSGGLAVSPEDTSNQQHGFVDPESIDLTTATANCLIVGALVLDGAVTITPGSGYTEIGEDETNDVVVSAMEFKIVTTATTYAVDWTTSTDDWGIAAVALKEGVSGPTDAQKMPAMIGQMLSGEMTGKDFY